MTIANTVRQHWAALRALLVFTVILGIGYPLLIWLVALIPGLHGKAEGSIVTAGGKAVGSRLIGQQFTDAAGNALPQYFQARPSAAGAGYDPMSSGGSNLGPESVVDTPGDPAKLAGGASPADAGFKASLLTLVCSRSAGVAKLEGLSQQDAVIRPTRVISINEPCATTSQTFVDFYDGVRVECAKFGEDYSNGMIVPIRGAAPDSPRVPADAVTASGSGLDPDISPAYADLQIPRVAKARHASLDQINEIMQANERGRVLGIFGDPTVNVLALNLELDHRYPVTN
jgi:potassium-transporting ATPase KdpC subunit